MTPMYPTRYRRPFLSAGSAAKFVLGIFGYTYVAVSSLAIATVGFLVWGHHLFVSSQSAYGGMVFSFLSFFVAVPSAIKVLNWTATLYKGSISFDTPMLYGLGFIGQPVTVVYDASGNVIGRTSPMQAAPSSSAKPRKKKK